jgi:hypothetical protein
MQEDQEVDGGEMKGFTIRCKGNSNEQEDVVVSDADAQAMSKKCEYFQNVFAHGTQEAEERIIRKPDWTSSTAKTIVQLLSEGNTTVHSRESFYLLEEAAQQILLNISPRVPAFVSVAKGQHTGVINHAQIESFFNVTEQLNGPQVKVEFPDEPISFDDWVTLLDQGIVMKKSDESAPSFRVVLEMNAQPALNYSLPDRFFGLGIGSQRELPYHLQARASTVTLGSMLNTMCQMLHRHSAQRQSDVRVYSQEEFSLRLPCRWILAPNLEKIIRSQSSQGLKAYLHKSDRLGYFLGGSSSFAACPTITGTLKQILDFINLLPVEMMQTYSDHRSTGDSSFKWCSLRVSAPRPETLDRLVRATKACEDNPNTLGVDVRSKAYFAVKTLTDMKLLLGAMINGVGVVDDSADNEPTLFILNQPKGVF